MDPRSNQSRSRDAHAARCAAATHCVIVDEYEAFQVIFGEPLVDLVKVLHGHGRPLGDVWHQILPAYQKGGHCKTVALKPITRHLDARDT